MKSMSLYMYRYVKKVRFTYIESNMKGKVRVITVTQLYFKGLWTRIGANVCLQNHLT